MTKNLFLTAFIVILFSANSTLLAGGGGAGGLQAEFIKIHLTLTDSAISSNDSLDNLEPGLYEFIVTNKTAEKAEFILQDLSTEKVLGKIKIKPNKNRKARVKLTDNGFRFKSSSNDTWYERSIN